MNLRTGRFMRFAILVLLFLCASLFCVGTDVTRADMRTSDAPHNSTIDMECGHCHVIYGGSALLPPWYSDPVSDIDDTMDNRVCWSCHNGVTAPFKETHSSWQLGTQYGTWTVDCTDCHWKNFDAHGRQSQAGQQNFTYRVTGTVASRGAYDMATGTTPLTVVGTTGETTWSASRWKDYIVFVDDPSSSTGQKSYKIRECDASSNNGGQGRFTVLGNASTTPVGTAFRVMRGGFINTTMPTNGLRVKYFETSGPYGFIGTAEPGKGICEVCHTRTRYFRYDRLLSEPHPHHVSADRDCRQCHEVFKGFRVREGCNTCHGQGQVGGAPYAANELIDDHGVTGEGVGSHAKHIGPSGGDNASTCDVCHFGHGMPLEDKRITIGFSGYAGSSGVFDGAASLSGGFSYAGSVTSGGSLRCSNVQCHDDGTGNPGQTPAWGTTAPACTACHLAAPVTGSHSAHLNSVKADIACGQCHEGAVQGVSFPTEHLDGNIDVYLNGPGDLGYPTNKTKGSVPGSCTSTYCHSDGKGGFVSTPTWGTAAALGCNGCHGRGTESGYPNYANTGPGTFFANDHDTHSQASNCFYCHYGTTANGRDIAAGSTFHINSNRDIQIHPSFDGSCSDHTYHTQAECESASGVWTSWSYNPGTKTCSSVSCHFGAVQWGADPLTVTAECGVCHATPPLDNVGATQPHTIHYGIGNEGVVPTVYGERHLGSTQASYGFYCGFCHPADSVDHQNDPSAGTLADPKKMEIGLGTVDTNGDGIPDLDGPLARGGTPLYDTLAALLMTDPGTARNTDNSPIFYYGFHEGACTNIYCHSDGRGGSPNHIPKWVLGDAPTDCTYCHGNDLSSATPMATGSHTPHVVDAGKGCVECHGETVSGNRIIADRRKHVSNYFVTSTGDPANPGVPAVDVAWGGVSTGGAPYNAGADTCSNIYCHSLGDAAVLATQLPSEYGGSLYASVQWGGVALDCNGCHGRSSVPGNPNFGAPDYANGGQGAGNANSHPAHLTGVSIGCADCHYRTTRDGVTINTVDGYGLITHVNGTNTDVFFDPAKNASASYNPSTRTCTNVSCHGSHEMVWGGPPVSCLDCHDAAVNARRNVAADFTGTSHHVTSQGLPTRNQCLVCHDQSQHMKGTVRLVMPDSGSSMAYAGPASAEAFCLDCHDQGGRATSSTPLSPFADGSTLGAGQYRAGTAVKDSWAMPSGHKQKQLTCLGDGTPNTGCHGNGHGTGNVGLLSKNMTIYAYPSEPTQYIEQDFAMCFDCHAGTSLTKEKILGVQRGGAYDGDYGVGGARPPYDIPDIATLFRDKNGQGTPNTYDDPWLWGGRFMNLHWFHLDNMRSGWDYRGTTWAAITCTTCHDVHGTSNPIGMTYEEMGYNHYTAGADAYAKMNPTASTVNPTGDIAYFPTGCNISCHSGEDLQPSSISAWYSPVNESAVYVEDITVAEDAVPAIFTVTVGPHAGTVTVEVYTTNGTATNGIDYIGIPQVSPQTLVFSPTESSKTVSVDILADSNYMEADETFYLHLTLVSGDGVVVARPSGMATILNSSPAGMMAVAMGPDPANPSLVRLKDASGTTLLDLAAFDGATVRYGGRVALGDVDGDGVKEIITAQGEHEGNTSEVKVYDLDGTPLSGANFIAFPTSLNYGARVAAGDFDGDGTDEIVVASSGARTFVRILGYDPYLETMMDSGVLFEAFPGQEGGVNVAAANLDHDLSGRAELLLSPADKAALPDLAIRAIDVSGGFGNWRAVAYTGALPAPILPGVATGGAAVAATAELIAVGTGSGQGRVEVYSAAGGFTCSVTIGAGSSRSGDGIELSIGDADGDGLDEIVVGLGAGPDSDSTVRLYTTACQSDGAQGPVFPGAWFGSRPAVGR